MVFQNYALYPHMSVRKNLGYGLKVRKESKEEIDRRVNEVAQLLGLEDLLERRPAALSGGQRQRVAMGRAIVREPAAYLMDEPLSNLDAKLRVSMRAELARLHERLGTTTVYVTHDQIEAMTLGDRVAVLRDGRIQQCDTPERLFDAPANLFVAAFMGTPPMNLVGAEVRGGVLRFAGVDVPLAGNGGSPTSGGAASAVDGTVIAGVRPSDLLLAGPDVDPALPRLRATLEVVERLGSESHVIFPVDAPALTGEAAVAADEATEEGDATLLAGDTRTRFTARVEGRRRLTPGEAAEFAIDPATVHLFDPETGLALR
jgi:multiple sugar transport system ATP-binding protein